MISGAVRPVPISVALPSAVWRRWPALIGAPIAGVVIILEMTMNYEFALAAMISVVVCLMVSDALFGHSFFDRQLLDRVSTYHRDVAISRWKARF